MKLGLTRFFFAAAAAASLLSLFSLSASAFDARNTATIGNYSAIDIADLYMFRDPSDSSKLVVALTTNVPADPLFGNTYHFQANALYRLNFTTRPDAKPTARIDFVFGPFGNGPACPTGPACQTFQAMFSDGTLIQGFATQGTDAGTHLPPVVNNADPVKIFAGPREEPFFFDLVGFNRSIAVGGNKFTGVDAFLGKNASAIVVEFPVEMVFPAGSCAATTTPVFATPCGAWAVTYLGNFRPDDVTSFESKPENLRQIDRMGNPLISSTLIPAALRDSYNFGAPKNDSTGFSGIFSDRILALDQKFGTCPSTATSAAACNPNVPLLASVAIPDILRFASNVADGYPNGRRPADRATDVLISLILQIPGFTDGTAAKTYCSAFPFLGPPLQLSATAPFNVIPQTCP